MTQERGSKKVEAYHLSVVSFSLFGSALSHMSLFSTRKHAVETTEMLDFLKEIVEAVPDPSAGGTIDLESENAEAKKKRGKGKKTAGEAPPKRRRKKKTGVDDDADVDMEEGGGREVQPKSEGEEDGDGWRRRQLGNYRPKSPSSEDDDKPFMPRH